MDILVQHPMAALALYGLLAAVGTMPAKGTKWTVEVFYDWFYDWSHVVVNFIPASKRPPIPNPTQPENPAQK